MTKDEALKLALETLEADPLEMVADANGHMVFLKDKAITAIKEALAQPDTWVGLTYEEKHAIRYSHMTSAEFIEVIEAKLKDKNTSGQE